MIKIQDIEVKSVMTKSHLPVADFSVNPYVGCTPACKYCYASFMKHFTIHPEPWGEFIDVKHWPEIKNAKKYAGKEAFFGSVTDCYQPHEAKFKRTRTLLEQWEGSGISVLNAKAGDMAQIYSADGRLLQSQRLGSGQTEIALASKALYIIKVADKVMKVRL